MQLCNSHASSYQIRYITFSNMCGCRLPCNERCGRRLKCGHPCPMLCGECGPKCPGVALLCEFAATCTVYSYALVYAFVDRQKLFTCILMFVCGCEAVNAPNQRALSLKSLDSVRAYIDGAIRLVHDDVGAESMEACNHHLNLKCESVLVGILHPHFPCPLCLPCRAVCGSGLHGQAAREGSEPASGCHHGTHAKGCGGRGC